MSEYDDEVVEDEVYEDTEELEDNPLFDALSGEPDDGEDADADEDGLKDFDPVEGDSEEVLKTKLTAKNRLLRQSAKSNHRLKGRVEELESKLNDGAGGLNKQDLADVIAAARGGGDTDGEDEEARIQALKDRLEEDPTSIVDILGQANLGLENKLANILQNRDAFWEEKLAKLADKQEKPSPEIMKLVGMLKQKEEYKDVDEAILVKFAKDLAPLGARVTGKRPPASPTGRGALPFDAKPEQVEKRFASELDKMGYGEGND